MKQLTSTPIPDSEALEILKNDKKMIDPADPLAIAIEQSLALIQKALDSFKKH